MRETIYKNENNYAPLQQWDEETYEVNRQYFKCEDYLNSLHDKAVNFELMIQKYQELYDRATSITASDTSQLAKLGCRVQSSNHVGFDDILAELADTTMMIEVAEQNTRDEFNHFEQIMRQAGLTYVQREILYYRHCYPKIYTFEEIQSMLTHRCTKTVWNQYKKGFALLALYIDAHPNLIN